MSSSFKKALPYMAILLLVILRFVNLDNFPVFGDETLYLYLAQQFNNNWANALLSVRYAVFPITIWILAIFEKLFPDSFRWIEVGRAASALFDLLSALLIYKSVIKLFSKQAAYFSLIIYLILPLGFLYSRMILLESFTNFFISLTLFLMIYLTKFKKLSPRFIIYIVGLIISLVLAFYAKPLAAVSFIPLAFVPFLNVGSPTQLTNNLIKKQTLIIYSAWLVSGLIILILYQPVAEKFNNHYLSMGTSLNWYLSHSKSQLWKMFWWSRDYLTIPILLTTLIGFIFSLLTKNVKSLWLVFWLMVIIVIECSVSANFYPRHIHPLAIPISILTGWVVYRIYQFNRYLGLAFILIGLLPAAIFDLQLIQNPFSANLALEDKVQFFEDWTAGSGDSQIAQKLRQLSSQQKIYVFAEDQTTQAWTFQYLYPTGNSLIIPSTQLNEDKFIIIDPKLSGQPVYLVLNRNLESNKDWPVRLVYSYPKSPSRNINIYKLIQ